MTFHSVNIVLHIAGGVFGIGAGLVPLLSTKGGPLHRRIGHWFVAFACLILASAVIGDLFFRPAVWLYAVTFAFAYELSAGLRSLRIRKSGPQLLDNVLAIAAIAAAAWIVHRANVEHAASNIIVHSTAGFLAALALYDLSRPLWVRIWVARVWPVDHGVKMTAAWFAMLSAGAGNILRGFQPASQLAPSIAGSIVIVWFIVFYLAKPAHIALKPARSITSD